MSYVLEAENEFDRLEKQSTYQKYDYRKELELGGFSPKDGARILDAGCGSGVVSRHIATVFPRVSVVGCDACETRLAQAKRAGASFGNLSFKMQDLSKLEFSNNYFDWAIVRYVLQHVAANMRIVALQEIFRCLRPNGKLCIIDFDGPFYNIYPRTPLVDEVLNKMEAQSPVDLRIGRKLPSLLLKAGFSEVEWCIDTIQCHGAALNDEKILIPEKLENATPFLSEFLGSKSKVEAFKSEYRELLDKPGVVLFYNKFIVTGSRPGKLNLVK